MSAVSTPAHAANPTEPVKLRVTDDGPAEPPTSDPDERHAKKQRAAEAELPAHDSDSGFKESEDNNLFTHDLEIDKQICREIP